MYSVYGGFVITFSPDIVSIRELTLLYNKSQSKKHFLGLKKKKSEKQNKQTKKCSRKSLFLSKQLHIYSVAFTLCHIRGQQVPSLIKSSS